MYLCRHVVFWFCLNHSSSTSLAYQFLPCLKLRASQEDTDRNRVWIFTSWCLVRFLSTSSLEVMWRHRNDYRVLCPPGRGGMRLCVNSEWGCISCPMITLLRPNYILRDNCTSLLLFVQNLNHLYWFFPFPLDCPTTSTLILSLSSVTDSLDIFFFLSVGFP